MDQFPQPDESLFELVKTSQNTNDLEHALQAFYVSFQPHRGTSLCLEQRLKLFKMGAFSFVLNIVKQREQDEELQVWGWRIIRDAICVLDNENINEYSTVDLGVEMGVVEQTVVELLRNPPRPRVLSNVFSSLTTICLSQKHGKRIIQAGIINACLRIVTLDVSIDFSTSALGSLKNLAISNETHSSLLKSQSVQIAVDAMHNLNSNNSHQLKLGLCAASLISRLVSNQEVGQAADAINGNTVLMDKLHWLLEAVLAAGTQGTVIGSGWNIANIVLDISILANHDKNKPLLASFVPLLVNALGTRSDGNPRLVEFTIQALLSLCCEQKCRIEFILNGTKLITLLEKVESSCIYHLRTYQAASALKCFVKKNIKSHTLF